MPSRIYPAFLKITLTDTNNSLRAADSELSPIVSQPAGADRQHRNKRSRVTWLQSEGQPPLLPLFQNQAPDSQSHGHK